MRNILSQTSCSVLCYKATAVVCASWSSSTWQFFVCIRSSLVQINVRWLSSLLSMKHTLPLLCFRSACPVLILNTHWLCTPCLHNKYQWQPQLSEESGLSEFYSLYSCKCDSGVSGVLCHQWLSTFSAFNFEGKGSKNFLVGHSSFKMSDFFKLPMTVGYLVCRDRAQTHIPTLHTLNCLTSWKWSIMKCLPNLLLLLLLCKYFNRSRQYTSSYIFSIWIPVC